jgi:hypothetical protein
MGNRRSWETAHISYWSLHVEAWRRTGLGRAEYCDRDGLQTKTFARWMNHIIGVDEARKYAERTARIAPEAALFRGENRHALARRPGILGDACGAGCARARGGGRGMAAGSGGWHRLLRI